MVCYVKNTLFLLKMETAIMIAKLVVLLAFGLFARVLSWMKDFSQKCQLTQ